MSSQSTKNIPFHSPSDEALSPLIRDIIYRIFDSGRHLFEKLPANRFVDRLKTGWWTVLYSSFLLVLLSQLIYFTSDFRPAVAYSLVFTGAVWAAWLTKNTAGKYLLAVLSFAALILVIKSPAVDYDEFNTFCLYIPIVYAVILNDFFSVPIVGIVLAAIFFTYRGQFPFREISGKMIGIMVTSIAFTILFYLFRTLTLERDRYRQMSISDSLTGLATLGYTLEVGQQMIHRGASITALVIDPNYFKQINDTFGHLVGNQVLIQVADLLRTSMSQFNSVVGRLGGDEFVILIQDYPQDQAGKPGYLLHNILHEYSFVADPELEPVKLTFAIGEATADCCSSLHIEDILNAADSSMYYNKYVCYKVTLNPQIDQSVDWKHYSQILNVLAEKDMYTYVHSQYAGKYAAALAEAMGLADEIISELYIAGLIHDTGKLVIPGDILRKPHKLTREEYNIVKEHVAHGLNILNYYNLSDLVKNAVSFHHERWDGLGYPFQLIGRDTPLEGRILQIADAFSAMTIKRVYQSRISLKEALGKISECSGTQFDPQLAALFVKYLSEKEDLEEIEKDMKDLKYHKYRALKSQERSL